jgi:hypothetical protein|tara:strand:+ start:9 stop:341 length:333 start_codon:yes stop_codon:yes gene_type:complete
MNKYVVKTDDKIVQTVIEKIDQRSLIGQAKYGAMMMEEVEGKDKDLNDFLIDVQEEIMDALLYIQAARACLRDEIEECMINKEKKSHKCGCGNTKDTQGYCDGSHEEEEL